MSDIKGENLVWFLDELANSESYQFEDGDIEIVVGDEHGNEGVTTVTVQDLAAIAIQEITNLAEQNKALKAALTKIKNITGELSGQNPANFCEEVAMEHDAATFQVYKISNKMLAKLEQSK